MVAITTETARKRGVGDRRKTLTNLQVDSVEEKVFSRSPVEISASNSFSCPPLVRLQLWSQRGQGGAPQFWPPSSASTNLLARLWVSLSPSGSNQLCSLESEAQTDNSIRSAKRKGKNGLSRGDGGGQMETESGSVYLSSPSDVCPPAIGCLPGCIAELSPTAYEVLNTEPEWGS